jgi:hypothetical protein
MNISLPDSLKEYVKERVEGRRYACPATPLLSNFSLSPCAYLLLIKAVIEPERLDYRAVTPNEHILKNQDRILSKTR